MAAAASLAVLLLGMLVGILLLGAIGALAATGFGRRSPRAAPPRSRKAEEAWHAAEARGQIPGARYERYGVGGYAATVNA